MIGFITFIYRLHKKFMQNWYDRIISNKILGI